MKPVKYGMKDATTAGISKLVREAEESGLVILQRNGGDVAIILPTTLRGVQQIYALFEAGIYEKLKDNPDLAVVLPFMRMVFDKISKSLPEGVGSAEEQPISAGQGEGTKRRRRSPALKSK